MAYTARIRGISPPQNPTYEFESRSDAKERADGLVGNAQESVMELHTRTIETARNSTIEANDASDAILDFKQLRLFKLQAISETEKPEFIPPVDERFFESQRYQLPFVKLSDNHYLFPTISNVGNPRHISECSEFYIVGTELLALTQDYYYKMAKHKYDKKPEYWRGRKRAFRKRGSNTMSHVQSELSHEFYDTGTGWLIHKEARDEINQKLGDLKLNVDELETTFSKGEHTSYGDRMLSDSLYERFGVKVKRQDGSSISDDDIAEIRNALRLVFDTIGDLSDHLRSGGIKISHSGDKKMHGRNHVGIFIPFFNVIGVSRIGGLSRTLAHELAHFVDYTWGQKESRLYLSDDYSGLAKQIAFSFRNNMIKRQNSDYQNRTKECFARAVEQHFVQKNRLPLENKKGNYADPDLFRKKLQPLIEDFFGQFDAAFTS